MDNEFYTVEQISELLSIHPKTIQRYIREGKLHAVKLGKGWRVSGHDLSLFTESTGVSVAKSAQGNTTSSASTTASCVVDINVNGTDAAIRIMNGLTAALNSKPPEYGRSSMHIQFIKEENKVRATLWGEVKFMAAMMEMITTLTDKHNEE